MPKSSKPPLSEPAQKDAAKSPSASRSYSSDQIKTVQSRSSGQTSKTRPPPPLPPTRRNASLGSASTGPGASQSPLSPSGRRPNVQELGSPARDAASRPKPGPSTAMTSSRTRRDSRPVEQSGQLSQLVEGSPSVSPLSRTMSSSETSDSTVRGAMSPSLEEAFASPLSTSLQTASTQSTESNRTIRGGGHPAGMNGTPLRTPSYPFPFVASSSATPLHQPFTALSPMSPAAGRFRERFLSQGGASMSGLSDRPSFAEGEARSPNDDDDEYPTPHLYDLVLQLSSEPNLATWWTRLVAIMQEHYSVDRLSLALPVDSTDIENVPWGQKAAFNSSGLRLAPSATDLPTGASWVGSDILSQRSSLSDRRSSLGKYRAAQDRPPLESRHSYAGYEAQRMAEAEEDTRRQPSRKRPSPERRRTSHASGSHSKFAAPSSETADDAPAWRSDQGDTHDGPNMDYPIQEVIIHPTMSALDRESDPLLESGSVNRVLDRDGLVVVIRTFSPRRPSESPARDPQGQKGEFFSRSRDVDASDSRRGTDDSSMSYEDYEQLPANLWSQSPAPSPAPQQDPHQNPFFATGTLNEDAFDPAPTEEPDYTGKIQAIGVDPSSTIIHIPLIHPRLSKPLPPHDVEPSSSHTAENTDPSPRQVRERKAPIAILSVLSDTVPYPANWAASLKALGPHLATSFHTCYQNSTIQERIERALLRRHRSGQDFVLGSEGLEPWELAPGLDSVLRYENDDAASSTLGSLTSPSEAGYSSHSAQSPSVSPLVTPGHSIMSESQSSYFDVQRQELERSRSSGITAQVASVPHAGGRIVSSDHRSALRRLDHPTAQDEKKSSSRKDSSTRFRGQSPGALSPAPTTKPIGPSAEPQMKRDGRGLLLHSHGADFRASFPSLPMAAFPKTSHATGAPLATATTTSPVEGRNVPPSDSLLRTMIDSLPVQVFTAEPGTGKVNWVNSRFLAYIGRTSYDVYVNDPWEALHADDSQDYRECWIRSLRSGQQFQHKVRIRRFDGAYRYHYVRAAPLKTVDQRIVHWVGVITDFHDQHVAEMNASKQQETAQSESKYRALANSSPQIVFAATRTRGVTFCNTQWVAYSGQKEEDARGMGFMEAVHPDDLVKCQLPIFESENQVATNVPISVHPEPRRTKSATSSSEQSEASGETVTAAAEVVSPRGVQTPQRKLSELASKGLLSASKDTTGKQSYSTEVRLRMVSGEYRWHLVRVLLAEPLISSESNEETWYGTCTDINDHKELEQTLKETMDAKSRFLSNMSHEIRTPLNGIWGMTNFLIDSNLNAEQADHVNIIRASTEGLRDLINDILDLSKVEAGMIKLSMGWLHLRSVLEDVNDLTSSLALDKGIELNYLIDHDVPPMLMGDRFRFRQVLLNVIGNAIKFTQHGEVFVRCTRLPVLPEDIKDKSTLIQIDVMDTGSGFSEKEADMLFKRFSQIDGSSTRQHGGSGLGLVISMQLVELHGGTMHATSTIGKGSCFTFTLRFGVDSDLAQVPKTPLQTVGEGEEPRGELGDPAKGEENLQKVVSSGELTESPASVPGADRLSPSSVGSGKSSTATLASRQSSKSSKSSMSSLDAKTMHLEIRPGAQLQPAKIKPMSSENPRQYSILVVCPLPWSREATVGHLESILATNIAHTITARETLAEAEELLKRDEPLLFSHIVLNTSHTNTVLALVERIFGKQSTSTSVVVLSDLEQKKDILARHSKVDMAQLLKSRQLQFIPKPIKPSRLALIFDPGKERELSTDVNQSSAQEIAVSQRRVLDDMQKRLGGRGIRVLLVEDNKINQMVMLKLLKRVSITVETVADGVQAVDQVLERPPGYYSIILMDLMMPNKDGYESCREIRAWEKQNGYRPLPIVALSANVLDDVWRKCKEAGFNSYITKPLQFQELSDIMTGILDPEDKNQPLEFMRSKSAVGKTHGTGKPR